MIKWWNTETRNEAGKYYRVGNWSVTKPAKWNPPHDNFTDIAPPEDAFSGIPYDWNGSWVKDEVAAEKIEAALYLSDSDVSIIRVLEDIADALDSNKILKKSKLPQASQEKLAARKAARGKMKG